MSSDIHEKLMQSLTTESPFVWTRHLTKDSSTALDNCGIRPKVAYGAQDRLRRVAPWFKAVFESTADTNGIIESGITVAESFQQQGDEFSSAPLKGRLLLKRDDSLPISGSVKARGGFHEVLEYAETLTSQLNAQHHVHPFLSAEFRAEAAKHRIVVGSTGNLGLSIGLLSAHLGFTCTVHMSVDAKDWKKERLRSMGVNVVEHSGQFDEAVAAGRAQATGDSFTHFVDDEQSASLFAGYSVAGLRLKKQLDDLGIVVDARHPLIVYLPCGVGGSPGGITFGLKLAFGDDVKCIFVEPTSSPSMTLGVVTNKHSNICVQDIGLSGKTLADGLAVARPSQFIGREISHLIDGFATVADAQTIQNCALLWQREAVFIEPSAGISLHLPWHIEAMMLTDDIHPTHLCWLTGGSLVTGTEKTHLLSTYAESGITPIDDILFIREDESDC